MLTIALFAVFAVATIKCAENNVLELTDKNFVEELTDLDTTLVMFYAPWCGHCKRLKPEFEKAAAILKKDQYQINLAKIDCTEGGKETCNKFSVSGYPTLKIFQGYQSDPKNYEGPREADGIVKHMRSQVGPASEDIKSTEDYERFLNSKETTIFGYFSEENDLKNVYMKFADKHREKYRFGHSSNPEVLKEKGETNAIFVIRAPHLANKFEESSIKFDGTLESQLYRFVKENYHGFVGHRTRDNAHDFTNPLIVAYFSIDYAKNPKGTNYWRNRVLKVAKEFSGQLSFAISSKDDFQHELNEFGYDYVGDKPVICARDLKNLKYTLKEEFSVESLQDFAQKLLDDELDPYIKSEPIPETNDAPVKVAVAKNFDEIVKDNGKDTLIEFYAPWCGHCKKLSPIYDELAEKLQDEDVSIVKMDATANDVPPGFNVRGFPTLFWLPKDSKDKPVDFTGGRELNDFIKFIAKHATNELSGYDRSGAVKKTEL